MTAKRPHRTPSALDFAALERLALGYVERYATSRAKLGAYLYRKLRERGWVGEGGPDVETLVARFAALGYVDDRAIAEARQRSLAARGYGARRLGVALDQLGIASEDREAARIAAEEGAWETALRFARRRHIGPFAMEYPDEAVRRRAFGAMIRAGHAPEHVRMILSCRPGDVPERDS